MADTSAKVKSGTGGLKLLMGFDKDISGADQAQPARPENVPELPSEAAVEQHELTHLASRIWCRHCVRAKDKQSPHSVKSWRRVDVRHRLYVHW